MTDADRSGVASREQLDARWDPCICGHYRGEHEDKCRVVIVSGGPERECACPGFEERLND